MGYIPTLGAANCPVLPMAAEPGSHPKKGERSMDTSKDWQSGTTLREGLQVMFDNEVATDVSFVFSGSEETVRAHKVVLMCRSHTFFVLFSSPDYQPDVDIEIEDIGPSVFRELITFLYCDRVELSNENAIHLIYCAQKYEVEALKTKCRAYLQDNVNETTAGLILDHAVFYKQVKLSRTCLDFISKSKSLGALQDYHVSKDTLEAIVECETLAVSELTIFTTCNEWAEKECKNRSIAVNIENKRRVLGSILKKIRFCSMLSKEFASEVSGCGLLTAEEELEIFRYLNDPPKAGPLFPFKERTAVCAKLPSDLIGAYDSNNPGFQIYIVCEREFKLLGFIFNQEGTFTIRLNDHICEEFYVSKDDISKITHLAEPVGCDSKKGIDIRNQKHRYAFRDKRAGTYSFSTKINTAGSDMVKFWIKPYVCSPPPFDTLILAL